MVATVAITAIICVLSFFVVLLLACRAPEMDDRGRLITYGLPDFIASPPIVPVKSPSVEETPGTRAPMNSRLSG
jgi:hypothetical protein